MLAERLKYCRGGEAGLSRPSVVTTDTWYVPSRARDLTGTHLRNTIFLVSTKPPALNR